ncbi:hypothetical protein HMPREF1981_02811 [Bacteroides pyogenes F0041]|uniref:Uncharacterized protein n=1 Tax=Bacteroides pyogenes F0041 TaxID=1321819 RepID=U2DK91_9BACE|nr:hypothetical protein HMPREF1981_02811 [Bacteroides pyogenes F0041]
MCGRNGASIRSERSFSFLATESLFHHRGRKETQARCPHLRGSAMFSLGGAGGCRATVNRKILRRNFF